MDRHKDQRYASVSNCPSNPGACCDCRTPPRIWRFFWFLMPLGPAGAVLYRIAETLARTWSKPSGALLTPHDTNAPPSASFSRFAQRAFYWIDWLPARLTAFGFAVVG